MEDPVEFSSNIDSGASRCTVGVFEVTWSLFDDPLNGCFALGKRSVKELNGGMTSNFEVENVEDLDCAAV